MNEQDQNNKDRQDGQLLNKINSGEVKMRPRVYFVLRAALAVVGTIFLLAVSIFLISFLIFVVKGRGSGLNLHIFVSVFPWILLGAAVLIVLALSWILYNYSLAYRNPLIYVPLAVIALIILISVAMQLISFHERFERFSVRRRVPVFEMFYRKHAREMMPDMDGTPGRPDLNFFYRRSGLPF